MVSQARQDVCSVRYDEGLESPLAPGARWVVRVLELVRQVPEGPPVLGEVLRVLAEVLRVKEQAPQVQGEVLRVPTKALWVLEEVLPVQETVVCSPGFPGVFKAR